MKKMKQKNSIYRISSKKMWLGGMTLAVSMMTSLSGWSGEQKTSKTKQQTADFQQQWMAGLLAGKDMSALSASYGAANNKPLDSVVNKNGTQSISGLFQAANPLTSYQQTETEFIHQLGRLLKVSKDQSSEQEAWKYKPQHQTFIAESFKKLEADYSDLTQWVITLDARLEQPFKSQNKLDRSAQILRSYENRMQVISQAMDLPVSQWNGLTRNMLSQITQSSEKTNTAELHTPIILRNQQLPFSNRNFAAPSLATDFSVVPSYADETALAGNAADLIGDDVVSLSPEIYAMAASLEHDYINIYNFVRQQITEQYYPGSMKGSVGTLLSYAGNDIDQAALLMALLRASNVPARFVQGVIEQPLEDIANGLGLGVGGDGDQSTLVLQALDRAGIAYEPVVQGGQVRAVRKQYTWVSAYVPYAHYRGSANDLNDPVWIPLAPAIKATTLIDAETNYTALNLVEDQLVMDYLTDPNITVSPITYWQQQIQATQADFDLTSFTAVDNSTVALNLLPASLPFDVVGVAYEDPQLPVEQVQQINLQLTADDATVISDVQLSMPQVVGRRLSLSYLPATVDDLNLINEAGGMSQVPPHLIDLRPVFKLDARQLTSSQSDAAQTIPMAQSHELVITLASPSGSIELTRTLLAGTYLSVVLGSQNDPYPLNSEDINLISDETKPIRLMHNLGVNYQQAWNQAEDDLAAVMNLAVIRPLPSVAIVAPEFSLDYVSGIPVRMAFKGISLDAVNRSVDVINRTADADLPAAWMRIAALQGSWLESQVFDDQWAVDAISADQGIHSQVAAGDLIQHLTAANLASVLPGLNHPSYVKDHLSEWINSGHEALIPQNLSTQQTWQGSAWHIWHPSSGNSGYFIAGGYAGGQTTESPDDWAFSDLAQQLAAPYAEGANNDPQAATNIIVIESTNNQVGQAGMQLDFPTQVLVTDATGRPVVGAQVTFNVEDFDNSNPDQRSYILNEGNNSSSLSTFSDSNGIAEIDVVLAKEIFAYELKLLDIEDEYETRIGFARINVAVTSIFGLLSPDVPIRHTILPGSADHIEVIECYQYTDPCIPEAVFGTMASVMHTSVRDEFGNFVSNVPIQINLSPGTELQPGKIYNLLSKNTHGSVPKSTQSKDEKKEEKDVALKVGNYPVFESAKVALVGECATEPNYLPPECAIDHTSAVGLTYISSPTWTTMNVYNGIPANLNSIDSNTYYEFPITFTAVGLDAVTAHTYGKQNYENLFIPSVFSFKDRYLFGPYGNYVTATPNESLSIHAGLFRSMGLSGDSEYSVTKMHEPTQGLNIFPYEIINETLSGPASQEFVINPDGFDYRSVAPGSDFGRTRYRTTFKTPDDFNGTEFEVSFNTFSDTAKVEITSVSPTDLVLDEQSNLTHPITIKTAITPAEFRPLNFAFRLLENGTVIESSQALHPPGNTFTYIISSGLYLNPESTYEIEVVMNEGNEYEVTSERRNLTDFLPPLIGAVAGSSAFNGVGAGQNGGQVINGQIISPISISEEIDLANTSVCGYEQIDITVINDSTVTFNLEKYGIDGQLTGEVVSVLNDTVLTEGSHQIELSAAQLGNHQYQIQINATAINTGNEESVTGVLLSKYDINNSLPIGHAIVKGVDLADGSMVYSKQDIALQSPGVDLEFVRTYSSIGRHELGSLGFGWSHNYLSRVIVGNCGQVTVTGADGGSARFRVEGDQLVPLKGYHSSLVLNDDGTFDYFPKGGNRYHYVRMQDNTWWMDYVEDPNGNRLEVELIGRNNAPVIGSVTDSVGRRLVFEYELRIFGIYRHEMLTSVTGPDGIRLNFDYDGIGNLISAEREGGSIGGSTNETFAYSGDVTGPSRSLLLAVNDQATGAMRSWTYQEHNLEVPPAVGDIPDIGAIEVTSISESDSGTTTFSYTDAPGYNSAATVIQNGQVSDYTLNFYGAATEIVSPAGRKSFVWNTDTDVLLTSETDENDRMRSFEYDEFGNVTMERLGTLISTYTYKSPDQFDPPYIKDRPATMTNWRGDTTTFAYDTAGNKTSEELDNTTTSYTYDDQGLVKTMTDGRGLVSIFTYDAFGYQMTARNPAGDTTTMQYNARGQKLNETDGNGNLMTYTYDASDRMLTKRLNSRLWTYDYQNGGRTRTETDPNSHSTTYDYDTQGRLISTLNAAGDTMTYGYDLNGNKTLETDFGGHSTTYAYDDANRLLTKTEPAGSAGTPKVTTYTYDNVGNVLTETTADRLTTYGYEANRYFQTSIERASSSGNVLITRTVDGNGNILTETDPNQNETTFTYDAFDRMLTESGPMGSGQTLAYDPNGNVISQITTNSTANQQTTNAYDPANRLIQTTLPEGGINTYTYDGNGNIKTETRPNGYSAVYEYNDLNLPTLKTINAQTWRLSYDLAGNLKTESWPNVNGETGIGNVITYTYDELNREISKTDTVGAISIQTWDADSNLMSQTDGNGNFTSYSYNALHQRTGETKPLGRGHSYTYTLFDELLTDTGPNGTMTHSIDQLGRRIASTGPDNYDMTYGYDANGNLISQTDSRGIQTTFGVNALNQTESQTTTGPGGPFTMTMTYDTIGNQLTQTDYRSIESVYTYDTENRQLTFTRAGQLQSTTTYNQAGLPVVVKDARGNNTVHEYNVQYHKTRTLLPESQTIVFTPNAFGDVTLQNNPGPNDITRTYDLRRRLITETNGAGETTTYEYDLNNNRTAVIKPNGARWEYDFDAANRLTHVRNVAEAIETILSYDAKDNIISVTDAEQKVTTFTHDDSNRRLSKTYPDSSVESYTYDPNGNMETVSLANGDNYTYQYDALDRQISQNHVSSTETINVNFTLDGNGNIEQATEIIDGITSSINASFDDLDRLELLSDHQGNTLQFAYDANGNRKILQDPKNSQSNYVFDDLNRLAQAVVTGTGAFDYIYNSAGLLDGIKYPNNGEAKFTYDDANRIDTIIDTQMGVPVATFDYEYDSNGNRTMLTQSNLNNDEIITYAYDQADRMKQVVYPNLTVDYTLDKVGNRVTESANDGFSTVTKTYTHNNRDQITNITDTNGLNVTYQYDATGNRIQKEQNGTITTFGYSPRQRINNITTNGNSINYKYDYLGNRIEKTSNGQSSFYTYDGTSLLYETNTIGNVIAKYHYGSDRILAETRNGQNNYMFHDALRTPIVITNQDGSIQNRVDYDVWGNKTNQSASDDHPFGFTGYQEDEDTGLFYAKARYYDPVEGVFLREDPLQGDVNTPPSLHRYNYAFNNPTAFIDPTGRANDTSHYYEALLIGKLVGLNEGQMYAYAIGAQVGDELAHHDAIDNSLGYAGEQIVGPFASILDVTFGDGRRAVSFLSSVNELETNNCGAHALCGTQPNKVRDAVSDFTLNVAENFAQIGTADHTNTDSYYHIKKSSLGTKNEMLHSHFEGHIFEWKSTDKAFLYHDSKRKDAFEARAWLLYEYTAQQGTQKLSQGQFADQLNDMLADLDQQNLGLFKKADQLGIPTYIARPEELISDEDEFSSMQRLLAKYNITDVPQTENHDLDSNINKLLRKFSHHQLKGIAQETFSESDYQHKSILINTMSKSELVRMLNTAFNQAQHKSKEFIFNQVKETKHEGDTVAESEDKPGTKENSK